jgi:hypothetical protein
MMGQFDVSKFELSQTPLKRWSNRDRLSKYAKFPGKMGVASKWRVTKLRLLGKPPLVFNERRCNALRNSDLRGWGSRH